MENSNAKAQAGGRLKLEKDRAALVDLLERMRKDDQAKNEQRNKVLHTSELVLCLRQSAYKRLDPRPATEEELGYYIDGNTSDRAFKSLYKQAKSGERDGVYFSPDAEDEDGRLYEFKATRSNNGLASHFAKQLSYYLAQTDREEGRLIVRRLMTKFTEDWKPFDAYKIEIDERERELLREEIKSRAYLLRAALETGRPELAPGVRKDSNLNWLCVKCKWKDTCWKIEDS